MTTIAPGFAVPEFARTVLAEFDARPDAFVPCEIVDALRQASRIHPNMNLAEERGYVAERLALDFFRDHEIPDPGKLDSGIIAHWSSRAQEVAHPILRARYADLAWRLTQPVTQSRPDISLARTAIDAYVDATTLSGGDSIETLRRLERALRLGISIGDAPRIAPARDGMLSLLASSSPGEPGIPRHVWDVLFDNRGAHLTDAHRAQMVDVFESLLEIARTRDGGQYNPNAAGQFAVRLATHYRRAGRKDDVERVMRSYGSSIVALSHEISPLFALHRLQSLYKDYTNYGLRDDAVEVQRLMKQAGYEAPTDLRRVPIGEIRADEIDKWTDALMDGGLESALCRVIVEFVPTEQDVASVIEAEGPLFGNLKVQTVAEGQIVSEVGGASDDPEGRAVLGIEHSIKGVAPVLRAAIGKLCERYGLNPEATLSLLRASPLFDTAQIGLVCDGIEAYFGGDHVKAIHVLVPQIERSLRNLLGLLGQPTNKNVRGQVGVMEEKSLNVVLDDRAMQAYLPNDVWAYLSAFLTDVRGMNVRNRIAHGLFNKEDCGQYLSDRVIHVLLLLAMIRHPSGAVAEDH